MSPHLLLPDHLRARMIEEAHNAFPRECCGLVEGIREGEHLRATAIHATRNIAREPDRFEIDPAEHVALMRTLRGSDHDIVGCYHSHPNGRPGLSPRDRDAMFDDEFIWIIITVSAHAEPTLRAFRRAEGEILEVPVTA